MGTVHTERRARGYVEGSRSACEEVIRRVYRVSRRKVNPLNGRFFVYDFVVKNAGANGRPNTYRIDVEFVRNAVCNGAIHSDWKRAIKQAASHLGTTGPRITGDAEWIGQ